MIHHVDRIAYHAHLEDLRDDWHAQAAEDDRYTEKDEA